MRRDILMFGLGAVVGAVASYLYVSKKHEQFIEEEETWCEDMISAVRDGLTKDQERPYPVREVREVREETEFVCSDLQNKPQTTYKKIVNHYNKPAKPFPIPEPEEDGIRDPFVIDFDQFDDECPDHDKITIIYYDEDGVLVDEQEDVINDVKGIIGDTALTLFGTEQLEDPNVVYVRNEELSTDFEIIRADGKYSEVVLGESKET